MSGKLNGASTGSSGFTELLNPQNCALLFIDHQPAMTFGVASIDRQTLINNCVGLAKAAKIFSIPTILTAVESKSFSGAIWPQLTSLFPDSKILERSSMNSWEDAALVAAVKATGRKKLIIAALWTEVCLAFPALCALAEGFQVYAVEDCSGGTSITAHEAALQRITQAGGVRTTWVCTMLEWQRDWARRATYDPVMQTVLEVSQPHYSGATAAALTRTLLTSSHPRCPLQLLCVPSSTAACTGRRWSTATRWCTRRRPSRRGWRRRRQERDTERRENIKQKVQGHLSCCAAVLTASGREDGCEKGRL